MSIKSQSEEEMDNAFDVYWSIYMDEEKIISKLEERMDRIFLKIAKLE